MPGVGCIGFFYNGQENIKLLNYVVEIHNIPTRLIKLQVNDFFMC